MTSVSVNATMYAYYIALIYLNVVSVSSCAMDAFTLLSSESLQSSSGSLFWSQQAENDGEKSELHTSRCKNSNLDSSLFETHRWHHIHLAGQCPSLTPYTYLADSSRFTYFLLKCLLVLLWFGCFQLDSLYVCSMWSHFSSYDGNCRLEEKLCILVEQHVHITEKFSY